MPPLQSAVLIFARPFPAWVVERCGGRFATAGTILLASGQVKRSRDTLESILNKGALMHASAIVPIMSELPGK